MARLFDCWMDLISKYFNGLSAEQIAQFAQLDELYHSWNERINVISRKDIDELYLKHVIHSLGIAKFVQFAPGTLVLDVGTGGGFPGIPLAIMFPKVQFHMVDSIAKKIMVVSEVAHTLGLSNVMAWQSRSESMEGEYDFVVSRAVTAFPDFVKLTRHLVAKKQRNAIPNGILYLKGGDFGDELKPFGKRAFVTSLTSYFDEPFFETKKLIHLPV
jgi:16S rRNA (guanine527-N7)-methyltransferase